MTANKLEEKARELLAEELGPNPRYPLDPIAVMDAGVRAIVRALDTARQSEGMVPHVWVLERVRDGAIRAVQREAPDDFDMTVAEDENNRYVRYVAAAPADAGEVGRGQA